MASIGEANLRFAASWIPGRQKIPTKNGLKKFSVCSKKAEIQFDQKGHNGHIGHNGMDHNDPIIGVKYNGI